MENAENCGPGEWDRVREQLWENGRGWYDSYDGNVDENGNDNGDEDGNYDNGDQDDKDDNVDEEDNDDNSGWSEFENVVKFQEIMR